MGQFQNLAQKISETSIIFQAFFVIFPGPLD